MVQGLTAAQVVNLSALPVLTPPLQLTDIVALYRSGQPLPAYQGTVQNLLIAMGTAPSGAPVVGTDLVTIIRGGTIYTVTLTQFYALITGAAGTPAFQCTLSSNIGPPWPNTNAYQPINFNTLAGSSGAPVGFDPQSSVNFAKVDGTYGTITAFVAPAAGLFHFNASVAIQAYADGANTGFVVGKWGLLINHKSAAGAQVDFAQANMNDAVNDLGTVGTGLGVANRACEANFTLAQGDYVHVLLAWFGGYAAANWAVFSGSYFGGFRLQ